MPAISKQDAQRMLDNVPQEYLFRFADGRTLANMSELGDALRNISDETFNFHVNSDKNDFSNWVRDVIKDEKLANEAMQVAEKSINLKKRKN